MMENEKFVSVKKVEKVLETLQKNLGDIHSNPGDYFDDESRYKYTQALYVLIPDLEKLIQEGESDSTNFIYHKAFVTAIGLENAVLAQELFRTLEEGYIGVKELIDYRELLKYTGYEFDHVQELIKEKKRFMDND